MWLTYPHISPFPKVAYSLNRRENSYDVALKKNSKDSDIEILELSQVLAIALGIKKKEPEIVEEEILGEEQIILDVEANERIREELKDEEDEEVEDWEKWTKKKWFVMIQMRRD